MQKTHQSEHKSLRNSSTQVSHHLADQQNLSFETDTHKPLTNRSMVEPQRQSTRAFRRSLNQHSKPLPPLQNPPSFFSKKMQKTDSTLQPEGIELSLQSFECPLCPAGASECSFCQGSTKISGENALIRFLSFVVDFKLGRCGSYVQELKETGRSVQSLKSTQRMSLAERKNQCLNVHYGYFCNACSTEVPIKGSRFCCESCDDYDLCQPCYSERGHKHIMREIKRSPIFTHTLRCLQKAELRARLAPAASLGSITVRLRAAEQKLQSGFR